MTGNRWVPLSEAGLGELLQGLPHADGEPAQPGNISAELKRGFPFYLSHLLLLIFSSSFDLNCFLRISKHITLKAQNPGNPLAPPSGFDDQINTKSKENHLNCNIGIPLDEIFQPLSPLVLVLHCRQDDEQQQQLHGKLVHIRLLQVGGYQN